MNRLLKSDFRKLFNGKSFWVCSVIILLLGIGMTFLFHAMYDYMNSLVPYFDMDDVLAMSGTEADSAIGAFPTNAWGIVKTFFGDSDIILLLCIVMVLFITAEYTAGTYKNSISRGFSRTAIYLSKSTVSLFIMLVLTILYIVPSSFVAAGLYGDWGNAEPGTIITLILINLLELVSITSLLTMLSFTIKSTGGAIALTLVLLTLIPTVLQMLDILFEDLNISQYWLPSALARTDTFILNGTVWIPIVISLVYLALSLCIGLFVFNKRDIK